MARRTVIIRMPKKLNNVIEDIQNDIEKMTGIRINKVQAQRKAADFLEEQRIKKKGKILWL